LTAKTVGYIITGYDMIDRSPDHTLEFLLAFDGRIHHLEQGYWIKFEIRKVEATKKRPFGLTYSLTLHAPDGTRLVGFDNAYGVPALGSRLRKRSSASDHWHRTENDPGRPYTLKDAATLLNDFLDQAECVLAERGIGMAVVEVEDARRST
jgi:hypothetical protein